MKLETDQIFLNIQGITRMKLVLDQLWSLSEIIQPRRAEALREIMTEIASWKDEDTDGFYSDMKETIGSSPVSVEIDKSVEAYFYPPSIRCPVCNCAMVLDKEGKHIWCNSHDGCKYYQYRFKAPRVKLEALEI